MGRFLMGMVVGGVAVFISLKYHIVRATDGLHPIRKVSAEFSDTYVDIRQFRLSDWDRHRNLAMAITRAEKTYLMRSSAEQAVRNAVDQFLTLPNGNSLMPFDN